MSAIQRLLGQTALYGLSSMLGRAINFLLVPFYTSLLAPSAYGIVTDIYAYVAFMAIVFIYGMETTYFRFASKDGMDEISVFNHIVSQLILTTGILVLLLILLIDPISQWMQYASRPDYIYLMVAILATDTLLAIPFARWRKQNKALPFASVKLGSIFVNVGLNIILIAYLPKLIVLYPNNTLLQWVSTWYQPSEAVYYIFLSNLISNLIQVPFLWSSFRSYRWTWEARLVSPMWNYSWPILIIGSAGMVNEMLDRVILKYLLPVNFYTGYSTMEALGIYGACYKLSMFMTLTVQSFRFAAEPFFFSRASDKNAPALFAKVMHLFTFICIILLVVLSIHIDTIKHFLRNETYWQGLSVVPILLLANLFLGMYYQLSVWYKLSDQTLWGAKISIIGAVITIVGNIIAIPSMGYVGAAAVTAVCYGSMVVLSYSIGQKHYPIPYNVRWLFLSILGSVVLVALFWYARSVDSPYTMVGGYLLSVLWLGYLAISLRSLIRIS